MKADINVTPLIDVLLVLLIIFMLVAPVAPRALEHPYLSVGRPVRPGAGEPGPRGARRHLRPQHLSVLTLEDLERRLRAAFATRGDGTLFVRVEGGVAYERAVAAIDAATERVRRGSVSWRIRLRGTIDRGYRAVALILVAPARTEAQAERDPERRLLLGSEAPSGLDAKGEALAEPEVDTTAEVAESRPVGVAPGRHSIHPGGLALGHRTDRGAQNGRNPSPPAGGSTGLRARGQKTDRFGSTGTGTGHR